MNTYRTNKTTVLIWLLGITLSVVIQTNTSVNAAEQSPAASDKSPSDTAISSQDTAPQDTAPQETVSQDTANQDTGASPTTSSADESSQTSNKATQKSPPKTTKKNSDIFRPSEEISEDFAVSFPADI